MNYKDIKNAIVWVALPLDSKLRAIIENHGYKENITYFDFFKAIYGNDTIWPDNINDNPFTKHKTGQREIQFMEWLEYKYGCNIIASIYHGELLNIPSDTGGHYSMTDQKDLFPIFDRAHIIPTDRDYIIDLGCGKGAPMISFIDYGFKNIGGVEMETGIYKILLDNIKKLSLEQSYNIECINSDATLITEELDKYNYFFLFSPFYKEVFEKVAFNIKDSVTRCPRKIKIIIKYPIEQAAMEKAGFILTNQFLTDTCQRVVSIYET